MKTNNRETFAAGLKMHRDRLGLTQAEAAQLCKVSLRVWSDWEQAKGGQPLYPTMRGVLNILGSTLKFRHRHSEIAE
jgi:transcriptional regulator with XRE-family HTH domain